MESISLKQTQVIPVILESCSAGSSLNYLALSKSPSLSIWRTSGSNIKLGSGYTSGTCDFGVLFCWLVSELSGVDPSPLLSKSPSLSNWRTSGSNIKLGSGCRIYFSSDEV
ncbi:hypothetical protein D5086_000085 [Populus alba]|uniref:Uncharacterized protein n=1 Tax=Populus alba TaxID=43335 RepID=A0ACC4CV14_POPAL